MLFATGNLKWTVCVTGHFQNIKSVESSSQDFENKEFSDIQNFRNTEVMSVRMFADLTVLSSVPIKLCSSSFMV